MQVFTNTQSPENQHVSAKLLFVDDNPANLLSLRAILESLGYEIIDCHSGEEALRKTEAEEFAVILLDVLMPGMSGFEAARRIRQQAHHRQTPIIFLTAADAESVDFEEGYAIGAVDFLTKPLNPLVLQAKVRGLAELFVERQRAKRQAEQLRLLVHGTTDYSILMLDPGGHIITWNLGAERLKGYTSDEIIGSHFSRFYTEADIQRDWPNHELEVATATGRFEDEGWRVRKDGSRFWANVIITALRDERGVLHGFSKVTRDLTARRETEDALRKSEERFRLLVEGAKDYAIFLLDATGHVISWNLGAERIKQYRASEIIGRHFSTFYPQEAIDVGWPDYELKMAAKEGRFEDEGWRIRKDGTRFWANVVITALRDETGDLKGFSKITRDMTERKLAEENAHKLVEESVARRVAEENSRQIEEQRERLHVTLASIGDAVISTDAKGEIEFLNPAAEGLLGQSEAEARRRPITEVFHIVNELTRHPVDNPALQALRDGVTVGLANHTVLIAKNGKEVFIDDSAAPIKSTSGEIIGSVLVFRDISEKKQREQALRESEQRLRLALDVGRMKVWDWNVNSSLLAQLSRGSEEATAAIDRLLADARLSVHPDDKQCFRATITSAIVQKSGFDVELRTVSESKQIHWIAAKAKTITWDNNEPTRVIGIGSDITRRKRTEQISAFLGEASATLAVLIDFESTVQKLASLAVPFFADWVTVDLLEGPQTIKRAAIAHRDPAKIAQAFEMNRKYPIDVNGYGLAKILQSGKAEMVSEITDDLIENVVRDPERLAFLRGLGLRSYIGVPLKVRGKILGVISFVSAESNHIYDTADLAAAMDLAERGAVAIENARLYRELREQDQRKDEFLATLAHELRNPLAPIRNAIQILKMPRLDEETARQTKEMMDRQAHHLVRLVDDLMDVSRVMRGKITLRKESIELETVIARAVETASELIETHGHHVDVSVPAESLLLDVDPVRMVQIVGNLLTNAAKYTNPHGNIWITARREGNDAVLRIRDNGIGIAPDMLPHVFELFVQADHASTKSQGGLGIGLTLVKNLIEMHGGSVSVESAGLGRGAEFTVRIPLSSKIKTTRKLNSENALPKTSVGGLKLMVVDDNQDAANSLALLLRLQGHEVQVAYDGSAALAIATKFRPEMILLDIGMPGMDGYEVARRIRLIPGLERTILVALTGWGQEHDRRRSTEAGFDHHLVKPPDLALLGVIIDELRARKA